MHALFQYADYILRQLSREDLEDDEELAEKHALGVLKSLGRLHSIIHNEKVAHFFSDEHLHALLRLTWDPKTRGEVYTQKHRLVNVTMRSCLFSRATPDKEDYEQIFPNVVYDFA